MKSIIAVLLFVLGSQLGFSQTTTSSELFEKNTQRTKKFAYEAKRAGDFYVALEYFQLIYEKDSTDFKVIRELADLYRLTNNYKKAEWFYYKITKAPEFEQYPEAFFYMAQVQKSLGKHENAINSLTKFKKYYSYVDPVFKKLAKSELDGCTLYAAIKDSLTEETITHMSNAVNHPHIEFSPIPLTDSTLVFGSLGETKETIYTLNEFDSLPLPRRKLYLAEKNGETWENKGEFLGPFNSDDSDLANGTFSLDSSRFYFTRCATNWQFKTVCQIYVSEKKNKSWSEPKLLNELINVPDFTSSHPTMGRESKKNQEVLYFISDREGSKGGKDVWFAIYDAKRKEFKKPRNAGLKINTVGDEMTPFYDMQSKTLYYSSNGKPTIGGFDLFKAVGEGSTWEEPKHMGMPLNSLADDLDYAVKPSGKGGYFVSNRPGGLSLYHETCCDDIYEFNYVKYITTSVDVTGYDENTDSCLKNGEQINVYLVDVNGKLMIQSTTAVDCNTKLDLRPGFDYVVEMKKEGYFTETTEISTKNLTESTAFEKKIRMRKRPVEPIVLKNIRYEFDRAELTPSSVITIDTTLLVFFKRYPTAIIELGSHTDSKGSDEYNIRLSQRRAESVVNYLISKGIRKEQLIAKGYGETVPIEPNTKPDGSDNPLGRDANRRTEFRIVGEYTPDVEEEVEIIEEPEVEVKKK